jgi:hypothetical protein
VKFLGDPSRPTDCISMAMARLSRPSHAQLVISRPSMDSTLMRIWSVKISALTVTTAIAKAVRERLPTKASIILAPNLQLPTQSSSASKRYYLLLYPYKWYLLFFVAISTSLEVVYRWSNWMGHGYICPFYAKQMDKTEYGRHVDVRVVLIWCQDVYFKNFVRVTWRQLWPMWRNSRSNA